MGPVEASPAQASPAQASRVGTRRAESPAGRYRQDAGRDEPGLLRSQLTNLRALLVLSILMTESADDQQILRLATSAAASLGTWQIAGFVIGRASCRERV